MEQYGRFAAVYDRLMADVPYDRWASYLHGCIRAFLPEASTVADCACGTGQITFRLAKLGYAVTGMDISSDMLYIAQQNALDAGSRLPFVQQDMKRLMLHRPADVVNCACDGVNYLASVNEATQFFQAAYRALKPKGLLLFDVSSHYKLSQVLACNTFAEDEEGIAYIWKNCYDPQSRLLEMRLTFFQEAGGRYERFCERHIQRAHTIEELEQALHAAGFSDVRTFSAFTMEAPGADAERIQFVAQKNNTGK